MRGIGKLVFARALAQALLCDNPANDGHACGACIACLWFEGGTHPDYKHIEPESEGPDSEGIEKKSKAISVDQIRSLADFINISTHRATSKIVVIHPAETLNPNAANALLKSLEEPPPQTRFILVSHRPHQLLATIKSRCQHIALVPPEPGAASKWLADNGVRRADVALSHFGAAPLLALELDDTDYWGTRAAFMRHLTAADLDVLAAGEAVRDFEIHHVITWLQKWSYDLVTYRMLGMVRYNPDHRDAIERMSMHVDPVAAVRFHREMVKLQTLSQHPLNARLFIEDVLLAYRDLVRPRELVG